MYNEAVCKNFAGSWKLFQLHLKILSRNEQWKTGIFDDFQIRKLMNDLGLTAFMNRKESPAWISFTSVVNNFLGNTKAANYAQLVEDLHFKFENLEAKMNNKIQCIFSHLDRFLKSLGELSKEQGKKFFQHIRYWKKGITRKMGHPHDGGMLVECCWNLQRHKPLLILKSLTKGDLVHRFNNIKRNAYFVKYQFLNLWIM